MTPTNNESETPETDAKFRKHVDRLSGQTGWNYASAHGEMFDFARTLEKRVMELEKENTELTGWKLQAALKAGSLNQIIRLRDNDILDLKEQRDAFREDAEALAIAANSLLLHGWDFEVSASARQHLNNHAALIAKYPKT